MVKQDISLEVNTQRLGLRQSQGQWSYLLGKHKELGGRRATLGSDSHLSQQLGRNFSEALKLIRKAELTPVSYHGRKIIPFE